MRVARLLAVLLIVSGAPLLGAHNALVFKNANLRRDPSATRPPVRLLLAGEELRILDDTNPRYLKVKALEDNRTGWVWRNSVHILPDPGSAPIPPPTAPPPPEVSISPTWEKPAPVDAPFEGAEGACPATGDGGDTPTNIRKNRIDPLPPPHDVPWSAIAALPYPAAPPERSKWSKSQLNAIAPFEGVALRTTGFLTHTVNVESGGTGESTNCHFHDPADVDWHIYLQQQPGDTIAKAVITETTPRVRRQHRWDPTVLDRWVNSGHPVRISGFLMLDPEHRNQVNQFRGTVWEIHPITDIEVCNAASCTGSEWVKLDGLQ